MSFVYGAMLWGAVAVAAPVVIHLLMRPRPRREFLPTLRFLRNLHQRHFARLRWKHVLLLALRIVAVLLIVLLLARPFGEKWGGAWQKDPVAMVVVLDSSASMGYRHQGRTVLQQGQQTAADIVESLPPGSEAAVWTTSPQVAAESFLPDCRLAAQHVRDALVGQDDAPLGPALTGAAAMLRDRQDAGGEILLLTDLTKQAFRGMSPFAAGPSVRLSVIDVGVRQAANAALSPPRVESDAVAPGSEVSVRSMLSSEHLGGAMRLQLSVAGRAVERRSVDLQPGQPARLRFTPRADREGVLLGKLSLQNDDPLPADNVRYFTADVSPPAEVLMVAASDGVNQTAFLLGAAVAPPMPGLTGAWRRRIIRPEQLTPRALERTGLVVLADAPALTAGQWKSLEEACREGLGVWGIPGEAMQPASWNSPEAQRILPAKLERIETLASPQALASPDTNRPMFQPFAPGPDANPPLTDVRAERRFAVESLASDAEAALTYADGAPAILTRRLGAGEVVLWNLSPVRGWSNLAQRSGQFVVLAQRTARLLTGLGEGTRQFAPGEMIELPLPRGMRHPDATLQSAGDAQPGPVTFALRQIPRRSIRLAPRAVGNYILTLREGLKTVHMGFSVNTPAGESDLRRLTPEELHALFPDGVSILSAAGDLPRRNERAVRRMDFTAPLFLMLLAVLLAEAFLANRFHRTVRTEEEENTNVANEGE